MPLFISEPPVLVLITLGVIALVLGGLWLRYRRKALLAASAILFVLVAVWFILGLMFESPKEESIRRVNDMAAAVNAKDWAKFGENVSESYLDGKKRKKADLKKAFDDGVSVSPRVAVWDVAATDPPRVTDTEVVIQFEGKVELRTGEFAVRHFEVTFVKDADGKFRLKNYQAFDPMQKSQTSDFP